ncbi:MAG: hypothetical protein JXA14_07310 [Anaerolineae bacterium]|nr:hypothetical protein [Anaerolineae bacterium]
MKPKQKRIVAVLVAANVVIILGLVLWVSQALNTRSSSAPTSTRQGGDIAEASASPAVPPSRSISTSSRSGSTDAFPLPTTSSYEACQWKAAQLLTSAGLDGAVVLVSGDTLRFDIAHSLAPGQAVDEAAQPIWLAFDIALALVEEECDLFTQIEVVVLAQGSQTITHISARVSTADLVAFNAGELTEDGFIQRVTYQVSDG